MFKWAAALATNMMSNASAALSPSDRQQLDKVRMSFTLALPSLDP